MADLKKFSSENRGLYERTTRENHGVTESKLSLPDNTSRPTQGAAGGRIHPE
jgi:hypothetical protein